MQRSKVMNTMDENDRSLPLDFDQSSISSLNHQANRLNDFSMLESSITNINTDGQSFVSKDERVRSREKSKNAHYSNPQSNNPSPERPLSRGVNTMREQENVIGELRKECFGLKLRIYYMEEQLRETFDANIENILKDNVELKVAVEELKNDIAYKTDLLTKASQAMEQMSVATEIYIDDKQVCTTSMTDDNFAKLKKDYEFKLDEKVDKIKELEESLYQLNEKLTENENVDVEEKFQKLLNEKDEKYKSIVTKKQKDEESLQSMICELEQTLATKEDNIETLRKDLRRLASNKNNRSNHHYKALYDNTEKTLSEKEDTIIQLKTELTFKTKMVDSLKDQISNFEQGLLKDAQGLFDEKELDSQKTISQLHEEVKRHKCTIHDKGKEIEDKDKALTEANEERLLVQQQKIQYELDLMKKKDSHIIELEIKVKQQHIDLEKTVDEHNRSLREKDDDVLCSQGLYETAQQEIKRIKHELNGYKSLNTDLSNCLQKSMEQEKYLNNSLTKTNEGITSFFQQQMTIFSQIEEKEVITINLKETLLMKEELIKNANNNPIASKNLIQCNDSSSEQMRNKNLEGEFLLMKNTGINVRDCTIVTQLRELGHDFKGLVETYKLLLEKLINNQHPASQQRILEQELTQVESTRMNFDHLLAILLNSLSNHGKDFILADKLDNEALKTQLEESRKQTTSLEEQLQVITLCENKVSLIQNSKFHEENETLIKTSLKKCESNEKSKELNKQLKEKQKMTSEDIVSENAKTTLDENINFPLVTLLDNNKETVSDLERKILSLQAENADLSCKFSNMESDFQTSNDHLNKTKDDLRNSGLKIKALETQIVSGSETGVDEKKNLKDLKDLYEMNTRLRKKVKAYELLITKKDSEIDKFKKQLINAGQTIKKLEILSNNSNKKASQECELKYLKDKIDKLESANEKYSLEKENFDLKEVEHSRIKEEFTKLKELVDVFTDENVTLKSKLHKARLENKKIDTKNKELNEKVNELNLLQTQLSETTKELEEKVKESKMLEYALQKKGDEIDVLSNQVTNLRSSLQVQLDEITGKENQLAMLHEELQHNSKEINEKLNEIAGLNNSLEKQSRELEQKSNDNKNLRNELQKIQELLEDNKLTDKLTSELIQSKSLINSLQSQLAFCSGNHVEVIRLKDEINQLEKAKLQLKDDNRKLKETSGEMCEKLSITLEENNMKIEEIKVLKTQMINLEEKIESFSPLYTSSAHNIALSSDAFTQTHATACFGNPNDSLIMQHIKEMQHLRKQLEETISNNDSLRKQLEERLNELEQDASLLQDPHLRITLIRDNDTMRVKLSEADENQKKLNHQIQKLTQEKYEDKETIDSLNSQMHELNILATNLKMEMEVYDRLIHQLGINKKGVVGNGGLNPENVDDLDKNLLLALLDEIRDLRESLQLTIDVNNQLREKLEEELGHPLPMETLKTPLKSNYSPRCLFSGGSVLYSATNAIGDTSIDQNTQSLADYPSLDETPTKDIGSNLADATSATYPTQQLKVSNIPDGFFVSGKLRDFKMLKQITSKLYDKVSACTRRLKSHKEKSPNIILIMNDVLKLVKELSRLLATFDIMDTKDDIDLQRVTKNERSQFDIATKLLKACDTLKTTKGNLQLRGTSRPPSRNNSPNHH